MGKHRQAEGLQPVAQLVRGGQGSFEVVPALRGHGFGGTFDAGQQREAGRGRHQLPVGGVYLGLIHAPAGEEQCPCPLGRPAAFVQGLYDQVRARVGGRRGQPRVVPEMGAPRGVDQEQRTVLADDPGDAREVRHDPLVGGAGDDHGGCLGIGRQGGFDLPGCRGQYRVEPRHHCGRQEVDVDPADDRRVHDAVMGVRREQDRSNRTAGRHDPHRDTVTAGGSVDQQPGSDCLPGLSDRRSSASKQCECSRGDPKRA